MNKIEKVIVGLVLIGIVFSVYALSNVQYTLKVGGMSQSTGHFSSLDTTGVSTEVLVTTSSTQVLATSSARLYAEIGNLSANPIFCNANGDAPAVLYRGIVIPALGVKVFGQDFTYTGAIRCIGTANASTTVYSKQ